MDFYMLRDFPQHRSEKRLRNRIKKSDFVAENPRLAYGRRS